MEESVNYEARRPFAPAADRLEVITYEPNVGHRLSCGGLLVAAGALVEDVDTGERFRAAVCDKQHFHPVSWRTK